MGWMDWRLSDLWIFMILGLYMAALIYARGYYDTLPPDVQPVFVAQILFLTAIVMTICCLVRYARNTKWEDVV